MSAITRRIEEAIETGRAKNYSDLAHHLGVTPAAITEWRKERSAPNEDQAAALASLLGKPEVMAECMAARTRRPETRAMWERAAKTLSMATALSMVASVVLFTAPTTAEAAPLLHSAIGTLCVMFSWIAAVKVTRGRALRV